MSIGDDYKLMLEAIPGLMVIDTQGKLVYINDQCVDYIKASKEKTIGKDVREVFSTSVMPDLLKGDNKYNVNFYFEEGRMSLSSQVQLRKNNEVVGVLEYDMLQDIAALDNVLSLYSIALKEEANYFREKARQFRTTKYSIDNILGTSSKVTELKRQIELAARSNSTVLITGETGTGKELVAHSIHNLSSRAFNEFVKINTASIPDSLVESELFGYVEGAFTGSKRGGKKGKFELADNGTLFIDEINQMNLNIQPKLLRALQEGEISAVGSEKDTQVNVRTIAATNEDLYELVMEDKFRQDLYYRLNVFPIYVPPLRERITDIPELLEAKVKELNNQLGKNISRIEPDVYRRLKEYHWPGNIRELFNCIESAMNYAEGDTLESSHFNIRMDTDRISLSKLEKYDNPIEYMKHETERKLIIEVLRQFNNNKTKTAEYLKISRPLLYQKMKRLGIEYK